MRSLLASLTLLALAPCAFAQKAPEAGYVYPPTGKAGTTVNVVLGVYDATPDMQFFTHDPRVKLEALGPPSALLLPPPPYWFGQKAFSGALPVSREVPAKFTIPAGFPPGPVRWQLANASGISGAGTFLVTDGTDVLEDEKGTGPQKLAPLPVAVCGRLIKIEETDRYQFRAAKAGPVTIDLTARRLGANVLAALEVRDAAGKLVADAVDSEGRDANLTFSAAANADYTVSVRDIDFRGHRSYVYRLSISAGPKVLAVLPAAGKRGETRTVEFVGPGVATGAPKLESVTKSVAFPATAGEDSFDYKLQTPHGDATVTLLVSDLTEAVESANRALAVPSATTGTFATADTEKLFTLVGKKGDTLAISAQSQALGSPLDVTLALRGPDGKEVARNDDLPGTTDAALTYTFAADGTYTVAVGEQSGKARDRASVFRLVVQKPAPDFVLRTVQKLPIKAGTPGQLAITATRLGGHKEPITLQITGLPAGVTATGPLVIPAGAAALNVPLALAPDAAITTSVVRVVGTSTVEGKPAERVALAPAPGNLVAASPDEHLTPAILVGGTITPPFKITPVEKDGGRRIPRGAEHPAELIVERTAPFNGEIVLQMAAQQSRHKQGIRGNDVVVPAGAARAIYPVFMPEWLETARTSRMALVAYAKIPDPKGNVRYVLAAMNGQITMSIEGALLKVSVAEEERVVKAGAPLAIPVKLAVVPTLTDSVTVELIAPDALKGKVTAPAVKAEAGKSDQVLALSAKVAADVTGTHRFTVRASTKRDGKYLVLSEAEFEVEFTK
ncbi:MAG: hypothetical protein FJ304_03595 [Planctomycetes bacterium]|nr:hypothetical protein [Planctomycetota bacterium]